MPAAAAEAMPAIEAAVQANGAAAATNIIANANPSNSQLQTEAASANTAAVNATAAANKAIQQSQNGNSTAVTGAIEEAEQQAAIANEALKNANQVEANQVKANANVKPPSAANKIQKLKNNIENETNEDKKKLLQVDLDALVAEQAGGRRRRKTHKKRHHKRKHTRRHRR